MTTFQQQDILEIRHGEALLRIAPQHGGRLLSWHIGNDAIIHWPDTADWSTPARVRGGNPLLFPFLGRHRVDGQLGQWQDSSGVVRALPMHGFARDLPFAFRFEAAYRFIDTHTLEAELTVTNTGDAPLPHYAGHHFYFALPHGMRAQTTLELPPTERRHQFPEGPISEPSPGAPRYTLDEARILDRFHCLLDVPSEPVRLDCAPLGRRIEIDLNRPGSVPWYAVTTWTEADTSDFYCVEPWLGLPDAIHNGMGLRWVAPGRTESATLRINVGSIDG
jgi:galactose mutarotase-like enzyme